MAISLLFLLLISVNFVEISCQEVIEKRLIEGIWGFQVFKPLNPSFQYPPERSLTCLPEVTQILERDQKEKQKQKISSYEPLAKALENRPFGQHFQEFHWAIRSAIVDIEKGSTKMKNILICVLIERLQEANMTESIRIGSLAILWILLEDSPLWNFRLINTRMAEGALSRATLELSLTKGLDLLLEAKKVSTVSSIYTELNPYWLEGLRRGDVLEYIRRYCVKTPHIQPSDSLVTVHDALLQASCPMGEDISTMITSNCIKFLKEKDVIHNKEEWECHYNILAHLVKFIPSSRKELEEASKESTTFQAIFDKIIRWLGVRLEIESRLSSREPDPYITALLHPFLNLKPLGLNHYEYIIKAFESGFHAKEKAEIINQIKGKAKSKVNPKSGTQSQTKAKEKLKLKSQKLVVQEETEPVFEIRHYIPGKSLEYLEDQQFIFKILYTVSPDVFGSRELLDSRLERTGDQYRLQFYQSTDIQTPSEERCHICFDEFLLGERVVSAECSDDHRYHYACLKKLDKLEWHKPSCPLCKRSIDLPLPIKNHVFWNCDTTQQHDT